MFDTNSEELFHKWMTGFGWSLNKIPTSKKAGERTPDFELTKGNFFVTAEVKEFDEDESSTIDGIQITSRRIGVSLRQKIHDDAKQLKPYVDRGPTLLVFYDGGNAPTTHADVGVAMYGDWMVHSVRTLAHLRGPDFAGGNRMTTEEHKCYLSAVCVMRNDYLYFYHNCFASKPLPFESLPEDDCYHFVKDDPESSPDIWRRVRIS